MPGKWPVPIRPAPAGLVETEPPRTDVATLATPKTVLLAEDDEDVRQLVQDMLASHGYTVLTARDPAEALEQASTYAGIIDLLLTDVVMPGGNGRDLGRRMTAVRPGIKVLYTSGYPEHGHPWSADRAAARSVIEPGAPFLAKPFTREALLQKIRELLA